MRPFKRSLLRRRQKRLDFINERRICLKADSAIIHSDATIENLSNQPGKISIGENSHVRGMLIVHRHGGSIRLGDHCFLGPQSIVSSMHDITIGHRVMISHSVQISDHTSHSLDPVERHQHFLQIICDRQPEDWSQLPGVRSAAVVIEDDVWICFGCTIMKGVRIGRGSVIGARSIVTHDVEPGMLYVNEVHPRLTPLSGGQRTGDGGELD